MPRIFPTVVALLLAALVSPCWPASNDLAANEVTAALKLAARGNPSAQLLLGLAYLRGEWGLSREPAHAARWLERAALSGHAYAQDRLADLYETGLGVPKSQTLAQDWREKAAHRGNRHAQVKLGETYLAANDSPESRKRAAAWLERARAAGSERAAALLAAIHTDTAPRATGHRGADAGFARNAQHAYPELQWLVAETRTLPYRLDEMLHAHPARLDDVARDGDTQAQYAFGRQFERGIGTSPDLAMAVRWYERAAAGNHVGAMQRLSAVYQLDETGPEAARAHYWQERVAALDDAALRDSSRYDAPRDAGGYLGSDVAAVLASTAMVIAYYVFLARKVKVDPTFTIHGVNQLARRLWVLNVMQNPGKDVMAVQTLRNFIMGASLMASTATLLIIGTLTLSGQTDRISLSWQVLNVHGSHAPEIWIVKVLALLVTFIVAFFAFAMCVRLANHVLFMLNVPEQAAHDELSPENVAIRLNRAGSLFALGMRAFFVAIPLAFWLFGPVFLVVATVGLVFALYRLDRSRIPGARRRIAVLREASDRQGEDTIHIRS